MAKCAPSGGGGGKKGGAAGGGGGGKLAGFQLKPKSKSGRVPNPFLLYYLDMFKKYGGNMFCVAKQAAKRWNAMSDGEKDKYRRMYCARCKACRSCKKRYGGGSGGGSKSSGGGGGSGGGKRC